MKSLSYISLIIAIVSIIVSIFIISDIKSDYKYRELILIEQYRNLQEENDMLYKYVENIDTFKTLDDAIEASQDLIDQIQMLYE